MTLAVVLNAFSMSAIAQNQTNIDSSKQVLNKSELPDSIKAEIIIAILKSESNRDSIILYGSKLLEIAVINNFNNHSYVAYTFLGIGHAEKGNLEQGLKHHMMSLEYALNLDQKGTALSNIGNIYSTNQDYEKAINYYSEAFQIFQEIQDSLRIGTTAISLGYLHYSLNELDSASYYYLYSKKIFEQIAAKHRDYYWAYAEGNLALIMAKQNLFVEAESSLNVVVDILAKYKDDYAICDYDLQLAKIYFERGELSRGISKAESSLDRALKNDFKEFIRDGSEILSQFHSELGEYKKAYYYQATFISYKDSLLNADLIRKLGDQQKEYEVSQKQTEVDLITAQQKTERVILWAITGFALVLFVLAFIIFKYYRSKARINKILEDQKTELESLNDTKDKFFSIISHDLRGPVSSFFGISRMIKFLVKSKETDQLLEIADDIDQSVERLSNLLDNLLSWAMQQQGSFPYQAEAIDLRIMNADIIGTFTNMAQAKRINLTSDVSDVMIYADRKMAETILRNLVNNALKFTPEDGTVSIGAKVENEMVHITVSDTGVGMPKDKLNNLFGLHAKKSTYGTSGEKGLGLGLQLVYEFVTTNNGRIEVSSDEGVGTIFHVYLPLFITESQNLLV